MLIEINMTRKKYSDDSWPAENEPEFNSVDFEVHNSSTFDMEDFCYELYRQLIEFRDNNCPDIGYFLTENDIYDLIK